MDKHVVSTDRAPAAIGPYSQAIVSGELVFTSGQIALDPKTGAMVAGDIESETHQVMKNLAAVLETGGASFESVLKVTIYLTDMGDFGAVNQVYGSYFANAPPARATVQVAALPKGARVEIDAVAKVSAQ